jgi:hypothetical protein
MNFRICCLKQKMSGSSRKFKIISNDIHTLSIIIIIIAEQIVVAVLYSVVRWITKLFSLGVLTAF